ncbi:MAG: hypothetical protein JW841_01485 [Deltaproteobacteria bacterium]|nr:hypothetical protein [Deltaproteobacteria bacterium]
MKTTKLLSCFASLLVAGFVNFAFSDGANAQEDSATGNDDETTLSEPVDEPVAEPIATASATKKTTDADAAAAAAVATAMLDTYQPITEKHLSIYGFADFTYLDWFKMPTDFRGKQLAAYPTFTVGHLNVYFDATLARRWRALAEVQFLYLPHGSDREDVEEDDYPRYNNEVFDYNEPGKDVTWSGISVERVWLEYQISDLLNIRAGQFPTPIGIWNVDHSSLVIINAFAPYLIRAGFFPQTQTGLELYGTKGLGDFLLGYNLTVSNGRGPIDTWRDLDENKAVGGRLYGRTRLLGELTLGVSFYKGQYTDRDAPETQMQGDKIVSLIPILEQYDEFTIAADLKWEYKGILLQSEAIWNERAYTKHGRPNGKGFQAGIFPRDGRMLSYYAVAGYRLPWLPLMPFYSWERYFGGYVYAGSGYNSIIIHNLGLNYRMLPNAVAKVVYANHHFVMDDGSNEGRHDGIEIQLAWGF